MKAQYHMTKTRSIVIVLILILLCIIGFQASFYLGLTHNSNVITEVVKKSVNALYNESVVKDVNTISSNVIKMDSWEQKRKFLISSYLTTKGTVKHIGKNNFPQKFSLTLTNEKGDSFVLLYTNTEVKKYLFYRKVKGVNKAITLNDLKIGDTVTVREVYEVTDENTPTKIDLEITTLN